MVNPPNLIPPKPTAAMVECPDPVVLPAWMQTISTDTEQDLQEWERQNLRNVAANATQYRECQANTAVLIQWIRNLKVQTHGSD